MSRAAAVLGVLAAFALGCGGEQKPEGGASTTAGARPVEPADSLVATAPGGVEIWFTLAREGKAADGSTCIDRALQIRRGDTVVKVPLLYTGAAPDIVDDTTVRARLSTNCAPGDAYLVDLRTGRPVRERR